MASLIRDVSRYEAWLRLQCDVVEADLLFKHRRMQKDPHTFLRATYFRWARVVRGSTSMWQGAPLVLGVGDCHVENFGTWRDAEGRQVWGVNDFDDAAVMPYTLDLVRLATSATLAQQRERPAGDVCAAILEGYLDGIQSPRPILLEQGYPWFGKLMGKLIDEPEDFWRSMAELEHVKVPSNVIRLFERAFPAEAELEWVAPRRRGGGGLGRPRFCAMASWQGGSIVREAKALVPSSWLWANRLKPEPTRFLAAANGKYRSPDPFLHIRDHYILRRIGPDVRKLDLDDVAKVGKGSQLLEAMGREVGAIHAAHRRAPDVLAHLRRQPKEWLLSAATDSTRAVREDYDIWRAIDLSNASLQAGRDVPAKAKERSRA